MDKGYVYARRELASRAQLVALLDAQTEGWNIAAYRYQERLESVELDWADAPWGEALKRTPATLWPVGRVFCEKAEVRWQAGGPPGCYAVQLVTERDDLNLPESEWKPGESFEVGGEYSTYLWGERSSSDALWAETRIPRVQSYPVRPKDGQTMVVARARDYRQGGLVRLTRLVRLAAAAKPKE